MRLARPITVAFVAYLGTQGCADTEDNKLGADLPTPGDMEPDGGEQIDAGPPPEFDPLPRRIGLAKAKDRLTGISLTESDVVAAATQEGFKSLIDTWATTSEFENVMIQFFADAFQQRQVNYEDMKDIALGLTYYAYIEDFEEPKLRRSFQEMFARTALGIVQEGRPFTEVASTSRFKLNVPTAWRTG